MAAEEAATAAASAADVPQLVEGLSRSEDLLKICHFKFNHNLYLDSVGLKDSSLT